MRKIKTLQNKYNDINLVLKKNVTSRKNHINQRRKANVSGGQYG